jgi:hypothetical protein
MYATDNSCDGSSRSRKQFDLLKLDKFLLTIALVAILCSKAEDASNMNN